MSEKNILLPPDTVLIMKIRKKSLHFKWKLFLRFYLRSSFALFAKDLGTILVGRQAVEEGLIDSIGGIHEAFAKLHQLIHEAKSCGKKSF